MTDLERRLRRIVGIVWLLGAAGALVGLLPGERVYDDANNCFGAALADVFAYFRGHHVDCVESYTKLVAERPAGGLAMVVFVGAIAAYGWLLLRHPRRWVAAAWSLWTAVALVGFFAATFHIDWFAHTVVLWTTPVTYTLIGAMLLLIFPVAPIVAIASRRVAVQPPPTARIVVR